MDARCTISGCGELIAASNGWAYLHVVSPVGSREETLCSRHAYCLALLMNGEDVVVASPKEEVAGPAEDQTAKAAPPKILVVDDDAAIANGLCELLQTEGYDVARAGTGDEALGILHNDPSFRLIILDLMMPGMDGASFRSAQKQDPRLAPIPVIVISAVNRVADAAAALAPAAVLPKPINVPTLLDRVGLLC